MGGARPRRDMSQALGQRIAALGLAGVAGQHRDLAGDLLRQLEQRLRRAGLQF